MKRRINYDSNKKIDISLWRYLLWVKNTSILKYYLLKIYDFQNDLYDSNAEAFRELQKFNTHRL